VLCALWRKERAHAPGDPKNKFYDSLKKLVSPQNKIKVKEEKMRKDKNKIEKEM
jgi:protein-disulfide isomerase